jgi:hypothetical protein
VIIAPENKHRCSLQPTVLVQINVRSGRFAVLVPTAQRRPVCAHRSRPIAKQEPALKGIYVTPHHQYPTTVTLGIGRRLGLLDIARKRGLIVIEDDYDHQYRFDGRPVLPIATRAHPEQPIIYIGSLSKLLAPAIRVGYVTARPDILAKMAGQREAIDRQGDFSAGFARPSHTHPADSTHRRSRGAN